MVVVAAAMAAVSAPPASHRMTGDRRALQRPPESDTRERAWRVSLAIRDPHGQRQTSQHSRVCGSSTPQLAFGCLRIQAQAGCSR